MKLYFKNSQGKERLLAECETVHEAYEGIKKFLDDHNYKSYYTRSWGVERGVMIDVGSYTEFFLLTDITHSDYIDALYYEAKNGGNKICETDDGETENNIL